MTVRLTIDKLDRDPSDPGTVLDALYRTHEVPEGCTLWRVQVKRPGRQAYAICTPVADQLAEETSSEELLLMLARRALRQEERNGQDEP